MTDEQAMDLGRRAVACKAWRLVEGMLTLSDGRVLEVSPDGWPRFEGDDVFTEPAHASPPDLRDAATLGTLLALVREAWGDPAVYTVRTPKTDAGEADWSAMLRDGQYVFEDDTPIGLESETSGDYPTEAEALVAALEAAP